MPIQRLYVHKIVVEFVIESRAESITERYVLHIVPRRLMVTTHLALES